MACIDTVGELKCQGQEVEIVSQEDTIMCFCLDMKPLKELHSCNEEERGLDEVDSVKKEGDCCETGGAQCISIKDEVVARPFRFTTMAQWQYEFERENNTIIGLQNDKCMKKIEKMVFMSDHQLHKSVGITICYYKFSIPNGSFQGEPVVLNFTNTDYFIKCSANGDSVFLTVEHYEKQKLKQFDHSDKDRLAFIFYMKAKQDSSRLFESAVHTGWFMRAKSSKVVMEPLSPDNESCYFLIDTGSSVSRDKCP